MNNPTIQKRAALEHLRQRLEEGLRSEPGPVVNKAWFDAFRPKSAMAKQVLMDKGGDAANAYITELDNHPALHRSGHSGPAIYRHAEASASDFLSGHADAHRCPACAGFAS